MLRKLKWQIPGEPLPARYNWCQGPVPGRGPAVEKHCCIPHMNSVSQEMWRLQLEIYLRPYVVWSMTLIPRVFTKLTLAWQKFQNIPAPNFMIIRQTSWSLMRLQGRTLSPHTASFPDDEEDRDGSRYVGSLTIQPPDAAASRRIFYWI